mmetsp:Transcript_62683/g.176754  ORF Transcript_62683/g.176754 Transcript_62683/m.176754 type:complete len:282 (-) Transcript_62683:7-852(-)
MPSFLISRVDEFLELRRCSGEGAGFVHGVYAVLCDQGPPSREDHVDLLLVVGAEDPLVPQADGPNVGALAARVGLPARALASPGAHVGAPARALASRAKQLAVEGVVVVAVDAAYFLQLLPARLRQEAHALHRVLQVVIHRLDVVRVREADLHLGVLRGRLDLLDLVEARPLLRPDRDLQRAGPAALSLLLEIAEHLLVLLLQAPRADLGAGLRGGLHHAHHHGQHFFLDAIDDLLRGHQAVQAGPVHGGRHGCGGFLAEVSGISQICIETGSLPGELRSA